jgi:pimeloyl-ACP methyl ester carboxylesterase
LINYPLGVGKLVTRVLEAGRGEQAVIFIHGLSTRADRFRENLEPLAAAGYRAIAYDMPGHGLASKPTDYDYGTPAFARFLGDLLDSLGLPRVHLVGTSLGGHVAALFAVDNPARVRSLMLTDAVGIVPVPEASREAVRNGVKDTSREGLARKADFVLENKALITDAYVDEDWRVNNSPGAAQALVKLGNYFGDHLNKHVVGERLRALAKTLPMMLVWGEKDRAVPLAIGEASREMLEHVRLEVIAGTGHNPYLENPQVFNKLLAGFLREASKQ